MATQRLGNELLEKGSHSQIQLPLQTIQTQQDLIARIFLDIHIQNFDNICFCDRSLLAPTNVSVKEMSIKLMNILTGEEIML